MLKRIYLAAFMLAAVLIMTGVASHSSAADVLRISKEELRGMLGSPGLVLIDVRTEKEWKKSDKKITGATWEDADELDVWVDKYPKDKTLVLYCS
jgi:rhodanese-related sulfurtransferase